MASALGDEPVSNEIEPFPEQEHLGRLKRPDKGAVDLHPEAAVATPSHEVRTTGIEHPSEQALDLS